MPMYSLLEYSEKHFMTLEILWDYYREKVNDDANETDAADKNSKKIPQKDNDK